MQGKLRAYFELLRFPAVFTAIADVMMGYLVTQGNLRPWWIFGTLVASSSSLYLAGMVLNDIFDLEVDVRNRPERPIPSGRISQQTAMKLGWSLLVGGALVAWAIDLIAGDRGPAIVALSLAVFVFLYDARVKHLSLGPWNMGFCRTLNVLLGMSLVGMVDGRMTHPWTTPQVVLAVGLGVYVAGVTLFARTEAAESNRRQLTAGIGVVVAGLALIASAPTWIAGSPLRLELLRWWLLWGLLAMVIVRRCLIAWREPTPLRVQQAVRLCIRSIIVIDAVIVLGFCGVYWGCAVLLLLAPMALLERWISTT